MTKPIETRNYRVWAFGSMADAEAVEAVSSFDARRRYAYNHTLLGYQDVIARRDDAKLSDDEWRAYVEQERAHRHDY
ncbi:MAG: hypothetical protein EOR86_13355 [Mesorhizobium sp.]|uniref:hypothetical protein n=1 Tax=Mesorhizobium sp. TaxID=1871066 RepID=UPI000FE61AC0|nr:hypothetical protein [Mesorhizobium sp.]RWM96190.1 MAG: hypothetical protein EOR86_13355 [Mesorhizobium sp.]